MIVCLQRTWGVWWLFLAVQLVVKAEVTLENGAYRNLIVSFSPNLPSDEVESIVTSTKELLSKTSSVLQQAIDIPIGQVTFAFPYNWDVPGDGELESISPVQPDILVDNIDGSPFGKGPFAEQFGGCGVRGTHIDLPYSFLTNEDETYPKEKLLAREWIKFRYGVFDEHGFPGDAKYPDHYTVRGDEENIKITECTDPAVEYTIQNLNNETCKLGEENCKIYVGEGAEEVKSSLMYLHEDLKNVDHVCGKDHQHNFMSPSKQNILCNEKSIWEILNKSGEFKDPKQSATTAIEYKYVKFSKPKMLILFEATTSLQAKKEEISFALRRVAFDLPEGTNLGLKSFIHTGDPFEIRALSELREDRNLEIQANFEAPSEGVCPLCALEKAVDVFPENEPGLIILITASSSKRSETDNSDLLEKLKSSHLFLQLITITNNGETLDGYGDFLKQLKHLNKAHLSEISFNSVLVQALYSNILSRFPFSPSDPAIEIVGSKRTSTTDLEILQNETVTISVNETVTIWANRRLDKPQFECQDQNGNVNLTFVNERDITKVTYSAEGLVKCKMQYGNLPIVQVTKPSSKYFLSASTWIHDTTPKEGLQQAESKVQMPVVIYAKINYGSYPVYNAKVESLVKDDGDNEERFALKDDGKGDPDITKGDGIYSGYFFEFKKEGPYNVKVVITVASQTRATKIGSDRCCGSEVRQKGSFEESTISVPDFKKSVSTVFNAISTKPENGYPPARILDLRVTKFELPSLLELSWTAPGGEVDRGNATHYELKVFCDHCQENGSLPDWISTTSDDPFPTPGEPGQPQTVKISFSDSAPGNTTLRITMETVRGTERSTPSNSVRIWLKGIPEDPIPTPTAEPIRKNHAMAVGKVIGWTVVGIMVFFCVGGLVYFLVVRARRRAQKETSDELDANCSKRSNSFRISEAKRADSFPVLLYTHNQVKDVRERTRSKDPPLYRASGVPPKPWVSLGELAPGREGSEGSGSTARVDDVGEMRQLDASSLDLQLNSEGREVKL